MRINDDQDIRDEMRQELAGIDTLLAGFEHMANSGSFIEEVNKYDIDVTLAVSFARQRLSRVNYLVELLFFEEPKKEAVQNLRQ